MEVVSTESDVSHGNTVILEQSTLSVGFHDLISNEIRLIFQWVCYTALGQLLALFGIVTNMLNIICFVRQGFKDPVNISLFGLSISDLCSLITVTWTNTCYNPALNELDLDFDPVELHLLIGTWPHLVFTHVTSWITAFITLERCMCLTLPLKVKTMITPKKVTVVIIIIFVILTAAVIPVYCVSSYGMKFYPDRNKTLLGLINNHDPGDIEIFSYALNNVIIQFGAFITVIVCTVLLVIELRLKTKWRAKSLTSGQCETLSNRDQKVARMMIMISVLFIVCFLPVCAFFIAMITVPQLSMAGGLRNTLIVLGSIGFVLESTNSSVNIFIYYHMSSRYRAVFRQLLLCQK